MVMEGGCKATMRLAIDNVIKIDKRKMTYIVAVYWTHEVLVSKSGSRYGLFD